MLRDSEVRRSFERLLRKLLSFPGQPAVMLLNSYPYRVAASKWVAAGAWLLRRCAAPGRLCWDVAVPRRPQACRAAAALQARAWMPPCVAGGRAGGRAHGWG
jgi:hypothetical protein